MGVCLDDVEWLKGGGMECNEGDPEEHGEGVT